MPLRKNVSIDPKRLGAPPGLSKVLPSVDLELDLVLRTITMNNDGSIRFQLDVQTTDGDVISSHDIDLNNGQSTSLLNTPLPVQPSVVGTWKFQDLLDAVKTNGYLVLTGEQYMKEFQGGTEV